MADITMRADKLRELLTEAVGFAPYDLRDSARLALYELLALAEGAEADRADVWSMETRAEGIPEGWALVPLEPTTTMLEAADRAVNGSTYEVYPEEVREIYCAMIDAALAGAVTQGEG